MNNLQRMAFLNTSCFLFDQFPNLDGLRIDLALAMLLQHVSPVPPRKTSAPP